MLLDLRYLLTIISGQPFHDNMRILTKLYVIVNKDDGPTGLCFMWQLFSCALENLPDREEDTSEYINGEFAT